ncbi:LexA family transcriptional regulator [Mucilaginibacter sp. L3T2-6]|uniref:LexA family protein n=1 Tax=Mucilaginibacter sp. L3T2-6 TaxID=3062491 RepID=UPI002675C47C|nr:S24 family peptidase [Mucilaginibacter sp. L3T2-6]MDO3642819.1 S24 family peptidase [Mucilaginibacter sp. L3T2-6]MDV6215468.1 S24 family peptidase [Mucilaginibacter sp. L3T2-6]
MLRLKRHRAKRDVLGFRLPMLTHEEPELDITDITVIDPDNTFYMRMGSDAMRGHNILENNVLVVDRSLMPVPGCIVVFFHEGNFYTREYAPESDRLVLRADTPGDSIVIEKDEHWVCWGVVTLSLNPLIQPQQRTGRYTRVCAC